MCENGKIQVKNFDYLDSGTRVYRGAEYRMDFIPKKITIVVAVDQVDVVVKRIIEDVRTGIIGGGKIFIY